jgi:peptidoglycan/LPS O-acetylase OafA/YrhL
VYGPGRGSLDITYDFGLLRCVFSFAIGMLAYRAAAAIEAGQGARKILASDALWLVCAAAILVTLSAGWDDIWVVPLFWMLVVTTAVNRSRVARALDLQPLYWLGTVSYSVYLTHTLILRGWQLAYQKLFAGVPLSWPLSVSLLAAVTGIVLMVSAATYHWIEVPGRRLISPESWRRRAIA